MSLISLKDMIVMVDHERKFHKELSSMGSHRAIQDLILAERLLFIFKALQHKDEEIEELKKKLHGLEQRKI